MYGIGNDGHILDTKLTDLQKKEDFSYLWFASLLYMLKEQRLLEELQKRQL